MKTKAAIAKARRYAAGGATVVEPRPRQGHKYDDRVRRVPIDTANYAPRSPLHTPGVLEIEGHGNAVIPEGFQPGRIEEILQPPIEYDWPAPTPVPWGFAGGRADGGAVSSEFPTDPIELLRMRLDAPPAEPADEVGLRNIHELAGMLPVTGNAMAAADAYGAGREAVAALKARRWKDAALSGGEAALGAAGALSPLPWGRSAGRAAEAGRDAVHVMVPAGAGGERAARGLREMDKEPDRVWRETQGLIVAPDGSVRKEISDANVALRRQFQAGDVAPLSQAIDHPKLFAAQPQLRDRPLFITDEMDHQGRPIARTTDSGALVLNPKANVRAALAKMLQYEIGKEAGWAAPLRHGKKAYEGGVESARGRADLLDTKDPKMRAMIDAYLDDLSQHRARYDVMDELEQFATRRGKMSDAAARSTPKNAGNLDASTVAVRSPLDAQGLRERWPYARYQGPQTVRQPAWGESMVLPPPELKGAELEEFIRRWGTYGAGRGKFAAGGRVGRAARRAKVVVGAMRGKTGGRSDKLPVDVPEGAYVVPAAVVAALGEGNTEAGMHLLEKQFGGRRGKYARGGSVPILISDGEFVVSPDAVAAAGGHDALDRWVMHTRNAFADHLKKLPAPNR